MKLQVKNPANVKPEELIAPFAQAYRQWGPPSLRGDVQFAALSHAGPIITCDKNGEATLVMRILGGNYPSLLQRVYDADGRSNNEKEPLPDRAVSFITTDAKTGKKLAVFKMRVPRKGVYAFHLYTQTLSTGEYNGFCNYLLVSQSQSGITQPFPSRYDALGEQRNRCRELNIFPGGSPSCVMTDIQSGITVQAGNAWLNGEKQAYVSFTHSLPLTILAQIEANDGSNLTGNVLVQDTGNNALVVVSPPKQTQNVSEVGLKLYVALSDETTNIPLILQAFISCGKKDPDWLPKSPVKRWGQVPSSGNSEVSVVSITNTTPLFSISSPHDQSDPSPSRLFAKGAYIDVTFSHKGYITMKFILTMLDKSGSDKQLGEEAAFVIQNTGNQTTVRLSLPKAGFYNFVMFGTAGLDASQLFPLYFMLIKANGATTGPPMPRSFPLWTSNICELRSPATKYLKRNVVNNISVRFAQWDGLTSKSFPKVQLFTDQSTPVNPNREDLATFSYEWEYVPGPGEKMLSIVAQRDQQDSNSLSYVLQFDIID